MSAVEQADAFPQVGQRAGQVHRQGRFAHAALAARDRDDPLDAGNAVLVRKRTGRCGAGPGPPSAGTRSGGLLDVHCDVVGARQLAEHLLAFGLELEGGLAIGGSELHPDGEGAALDGDVFDESERDDIARIAWILDRLERGEHGVVCQHAGSLMARGQFGQCHVANHPQEAPPA